MKKIILTAATILTLISCSNNDNKDTNQLKNKINGSWKLVGYYDDVDGDPVTGTNYHLVENGSVVIFYSNDTFDLPAQNYNPIGNYNITADSLLTLNYNENFTWNPNSSISNKITLLTNEYLELSAPPNTGAIAASERYAKVINP